MDIPKLPKKAPKADIVEPRKFRTVLEKPMIHTICEAIALGLPMTTVAGLVGVTRQTFYRWLADGQDPKCQNPLVVELAVRVMEARAKASLEGVKMMNQHALADWKAQLELLRAQDPETWSPKAQSTVKVEVATVQKRDLSVLSDAELEELERIEAKLGAIDAHALPSGD